MRGKYVAVLDVRSREMTAVVAEKGVNNTFIIKSKYTACYDGFAEGEFLDVGSFSSAVCDVVGKTLTSLGGIKSFYVGVPGEFLSLVNVDRTLSFHNLKKITSYDMEELAAAAMPASDGKWRFIRSSCLYYTLSDKRKTVNPVGCVSDGLQGSFCFFRCDNAFIGCLMDAFKRFGEIATVNLLPAPYAEAMYLVEPEIRDDCAVLFDFGDISSTYSVVRGNGLLYSEAFSVGVGHVAMYLMSEFDMPYEVASEFLKTVNLNAKERLSAKEECVYEGKVYSFPTVELRDKIREALDGICETLEECRQNYSGKSIDGKPLLVTGEGVKTIRGAVEHISGRLVKAVEAVAPKIPYYDKPQFGSLFSLIDMALNDEKNR